MATKPLPPAEAAMILRRTRDMRLRIGVTLELWNGSDRYRVELSTAGKQRARHVLIGKSTQGPGYLATDLYAMPVNRIVRGLYQIAKF